MDGKAEEHTNGKDVSSVDLFEHTEPSDSEGAASIEKNKPKPSKNKIDTNKEAGRSNAGVRTGTSIFSLLLIIIG